MNVRTLRTFVKALRGRGLKRVAAPSPGSVQWHIATSDQPGFRLGDLPEKRAWFTKHYFDVTSPTGIRGYVSGAQRPTGIHIGGVFAKKEEQALDLGIKEYRRLFRDLRSAVGVPAGTPITFYRIPNDFMSRQIRRRNPRERIILR